MKLAFEMGSGAMMYITKFHNDRFRQSKVGEGGYIVFKHPVALIYHLFHMYFRLKCNF
jgi:hypothetical protein